MYRILFIMIIICIHIVYLYIIRCIILNVMIIYTDSKHLFLIN